VGGGGAEVQAMSNGGDGSDWWRWDLDFREIGRRENKEEMGELYGAGEKMAKEVRKSELKAGHVKPKNECD
jgi:hypothetical protein